MLIVSLNNIEELDYLNTYANGVVVYTNDFSSFYNKAYDLDEIKEIYKKKKDLMMFIDLCMMMENKDINKLSNFIDSLKDLDLYYYYSDLGVHQLLKDKGLENRGVFNPSTLITNSYDLNFYLAQNILSAQISNEIPVRDMISISNANNHNIWLKAFGYHQMFHSKRPLISLYSDHLGRDIKIDTQNSFLKEQKRDDFYHIYQGKHGTLLFRSYVLDYLDEIKDINPKYVFLDNIFLNIDVFHEVVKNFALYLEGNLSKEEARFNLNSLNLDVQEGFKINDTVYQKEKLHE